MKITLTFAMMVGFTVIANLLLKIGAVSGGSAQGSITHLLNWRILRGLSNFRLRTPGVSPEVKASDAGKILNVGVVPPVPRA